MVVERKALERQLIEARKKLAMGGRGGDAADTIIISTTNGEVRFMGRKLDDVPPQELKGLVDAGKATIGSGIVAICTRAPDGKAGIVVGVTSDLTDKFDAVSLVRAGSQAVGGKGGGGRTDLAQAGGPDGQKTADALAAIKAAITG